MPELIRRSAPLLLAAVVGAAAGLLALGELAVGDAERRPIDAFAAVVDRVERDYVEPVERKRLVEAAIDGMLSDLDPYSGYLDPQAFEDMRIRTEGEFGGLGIRVTRRDKLLEVVSPIADTPADRAGLRPGDLIVRLDGEPLRTMTLGEAVGRMRGEPGTSITLTVKRGEQAPFDVEITRAKIELEPVRARLEGAAGYLRLTAFNQRTRAALEDAVARLRREAGGGVEGYVLDLRNNPGGLLEQAVAVADAFLEAGTVVSIRGRTGETERFQAAAGDVAGGAPVVVLINRGSASASEIVAGALKDHGRATVVGTRSFGKGSVQEVIRLSDFGAIRLTTARYYTPSGDAIAEAGVAPDVEAAGAPEAVGKPPAEDGQLARALEVLRQRAAAGG